MALSLLIRLFPLYNIVRAVINGLVFNQDIRWYITFIIPALATVAFIVLVFMVAKKNFLLMFIPLAIYPLYTVYQFFMSITNAWNSAYNFFVLLIPAAVLIIVILTATGTVQSKLALAVTGAAAAFLALVTPVAYITILTRGYSFIQFLRSTWYNIAAGVLFYVSYTVLALGLSRPQEDEQRTPLNR